ncbi:hypothetical protein L7F22_016237 [Adiantum nelumboides]|nr:hypothetical protein [Adiantum nelumboides]
MEACKRALDLSMKAIDAYKKTLLVDKVTSDDEKPPPVYTLDEIANILMSCSLELTKEIVEYTFRRLQHRSPYVKWKALRFIKYTVEKAGSSSYRRELQSHSVAVRELINYQGQVDPLKGNAPNQAVRDAAQEAVKAIFSSDTSSKGKSIRIEGFGSGCFSKDLTSLYRNSDYDEMGRESFYSSKGSRNLGYCDNSGSFEDCKSNDSFEYQNDIANREFTKGFDQYDGAVNILSLNWEQDGKGAMGNKKLLRHIEGSHVCTRSEKVASPEERLLNNVTNIIGTRLRPTEQTLQNFFSSSKTLDAARIIDALKEKLHSSSWQVSLKALCVLKAILLRKDASLLQEIQVDEEDFHGFVQESLQSAQTTLRREAQEAFELILALKEEKLGGKTVNCLSEDAFCDKPFITMEAENQMHKSIKSQSEVGDLLSFQMEDLLCGQAANTSSDSAIDDPFDGMCIYGLNDKAAIHVKDLLSDGWASAHAERHSESSVSWQSSAVKQKQSEIDVLGFNSVFDLTSNMSYPTGKCQGSSFDSHYNLDALYMHLKGAMGPLHTSTCL